MINVERQFDKATKTFRLPKGAKSRCVPCNSSLLSELQQLIMAQKIPQERTIFAGPLGEPIRHETFVARRFKKDMGEAGVRKIRFHDMRHTAGTLMVAKGLDPKTVQVIMGHEDLATTMIYVHANQDAVKKAARAFSVAPTAKPANSSHLRLISK